MNFTKFTGMKKIIYLLLLFSGGLQAQELKLEDIMKGHEFVGNLPSNHFWSWDSKRIYFDWNPENNPGNSLYYWEKGMKAPEKVAHNELQASYLNDLRQQGRKMRFYTKNGALFAFDTQKMTHRKLIHTQNPIHGLQLTQNPAVIYFTQDNNIFQYNVLTNALLQVTNFKFGSKGGQGGSNTFLEDQQQELFQYIRDKNKRNVWNKEQQQKNAEKFPKAFHYGKYNLENIRISTDEQYVVFRLSSYPEGLETTYQNFITPSGYLEESKAREKVSVDAISEHKLAIYSMAADSVYFVSFSNLSDIRRNPSYLSLYPNYQEFRQSDRPVIMHEVHFNEKGTQAICDVRSLDNKDRWIVSLDLKNGKIYELEHQHDAAWIGGPGISDYGSGTLGFLKDNETIYFQSEESGFSHLYFLNVLTKKKQQVTSGNWEVREVALSLTKDYFYITANKNHPGNREFYRLKIADRSLEPILAEEGAVDVQLSPDEKSLAVLYSSKTRPWELYFAENKANATKMQVTHSTTPAFDSQNWLAPEVIAFEASDKTNVHARIYIPETQKKNGAAVIFVHGAGYLQNAHNHWSTYFREFMFHNLLVQKGFTVLDIDYRASDGYGRDFRTGIYRHMGGLDLSDQLDGKKLLVEKYGIDPKRVGMYGGSYGGFITLMALLNHPGEFKCGAALRSVTDWAHYNQGYTSNILNYPETDPEAYRKSSPIYYADKLQDHLLMLHGMVDDNVHFQDIVRLSERFIELGKDNWELAIYPVEAHGFKESYSWLDEYKRILKLFEENLSTH